MTKRNMNSVAHKEWSRKVRERDGYKCVACGKWTKWCHAHHLDGYDWAVSLREEVANGVALCPGRKGCHLTFHKLYGNQNNTRYQFDEYLRLYHGKSLADIKL
jgi:hypothetical protein